MDGNLVIKIKSFTEDILAVTNNYINDIPATVMIDKINILVVELAKQANNQYNQAMQLKEKESEVNADG